MSFFQGASNIRITGGQFNTISGNYVVHHQSRLHKNTGSFNTRNTDDDDKHTDDPSLTQPTQTDHDELRPFFPPVRSDLQQPPVALPTSLNAPSTLIQTCHIQSSPQRLKEPSVRTTPPAASPNCPCSHQQRSPEPPRCSSPPVNPAKPTNIGCGNADDIHVQGLHYDYSIDVSRLVLPPRQHKVIIPRKSAGAARHGRRNLWSQAQRNYLFVLTFLLALSPYIYEIFSPDFSDPRLHLHLHFHETSVEARLERVAPSYPDKNHPLPLNDFACPVNSVSHRDL